MYRRSVVLSSVSRTAVGVAHIRARESARGDGLFDDPLAAVFAAALGDEPAPAEEMSPQRRAIAFQVIVRTRFYDDYLLAAAAAGIRQVVVLAAGLDARAFRLPWPEHTRLFELDLPAMVDAKERVLRTTQAIPNCERIVVAADLSREWLSALEGAGWDAARPTAWLAEGLLVYLEQPVAESVLDHVTQASAAGSRFATERSSATSAAQLAAGDTEAVTRLWKGGLGEAAQEWLAARGWVVQVDNLGDVAAGYGRPITRETAAGFITATRP